MDASMSEDEKRQEALRQLSAQLNLNAGPFSPYSYTWGVPCPSPPPAFGGTISSEGHVVLRPLTPNLQSDEQASQEPGVQRQSLSSSSAGVEPESSAREPGEGPETDEPFSSIAVRTAANVLGLEYMAHRPLARHVDLLAKTITRMFGNMIRGPRARVRFGGNVLDIRFVSGKPSNPGLCTQCQDFAPRQKFALFGYGHRQVEDAVWKLNHLEKNETCCAFCKFLITTVGLGRSSIETNDPDAAVALSLTSMIHEGLNWSGGFRGFLLSLTADDIAEDSYQRCICPWPGWIEPLVDMKQEGWWKKEVHTVNLHDSRRRIDTADLKSMLQLCNSKDFGCSPHFEDIPGLRVIDVQAGCVVKAPADCCYAALSYVWGGVQQTRLTHETEKLLTTPGSVHPDAEFLSTVVRDTLYFCDALQQPYLWIDNLCIMQDDPQDVAMQMSYMDAVYHTAEFTIVAAAGTDCNVGLPGLRSSRSTQPRMVTGTIDGISMVGAYVRKPDLLLNCKWNSRGWTLQEQVFSRRAFVFTEELAYFICGQRILREDHIFEPSPSVSSRNPSIVWNWTQALDAFQDEEAPTHHLFCTFFPEEPTGASAFALWQRLLPLYLERDLTHSSDAVNAFKGVLRSLDTPLQGFRSAMPKKFFARSLLWYGLYFRKADYSGFPTWSWAAWVRHRSNIKIGFQEQNDCIQWTPIFTALDELISSPEANFREPETFGHSHSHDNVRGQEHFACSNNPEGMDFDVDRNFQHEHFASIDVDKNSMEAMGKGFPSEQRVSDIVFFYTSTLSLSVDRTNTPVIAPGQRIGDESLTRCAIRVSDGTVLDHIVLGKEWRNRQPDKLDFLALFVHEDRYPPVFAMALTKMSEYFQRWNRESYHPGKYPSGDDCYAIAAMLVEWDEHGIARRVGLPEENAIYYQTWLKEGPEFKLVALG